MTSMQVEYSKLKETQKHNRAMEQQQANELAETQLHNRNVEFETAKHNRMSEDLTAASNEVSKYVADMRAYGTITAAEINAASAEKRQEMINESNETLKNLQIAADKQIARADRAVKWAQTKAENTKKAKEVELLAKQIDGYSQSLENATMQAVAATQNANTNLARLGIDQSEVQRKASRDEWEQQTAAANTALREAELDHKKINDTWNMILKTVSTIADVANPLDDAIHGSDPGVT